MKRFFTFLLMFACAMFVGVSCVKDQPDGPAEEVIDEVTPETFEIKFDESTKTCANVDFYCIPANKTKPYMVITSQEFNDDTIKNLISGANTVEAKLRQLLMRRAALNQLVWPVDNNALYKGDSNRYPKSATRTSNDEKVDVYVVGVKILQTADISNGDKLITSAELSTEIFTFEVPFLPYPVLTLGSLSGNLSHEEGSTTVSCTLENALDGYEVRCQCVEDNCNWVRPSYENGVLTIAYDKNPYAIPRQAKVSVEYGRYESKKENGEVKQVWKALVYEKTVTVTQEADPSAPKYTFEVEVIGSYFNKAVVNITPSDNALSDNVDYVARVHMPTSDWASVAVGNMKYPESNTYLNGKKENYNIKVEPRNLDINDKEEYYVYVYAVDKAHTAPISEVSYAKVIYTTEGTPKFRLEEKTVAEGDGAHYKVSDNGELIEVTKSGLIEIPFVIDNPIDGAAVYFNDGNMLQEKTFATNSAGDQYNVIGNNHFASTKDGKLMLTTSNYPSDWDKGYNPYVDISLKYTDADQTFCVTNTIRIRLKK